MGNTSSSPGVDQAMIALDQSIQQKRKSGGKKRSKARRSSSHSSHSNRNDLACVLDEYDASEVMRVMKELRRDRQAQKLLDEFVDYKTGKSTRKPRLLDILDSSSSRDRQDVPITEIQLDA